jgi:F420-dependent oxidoreductase-like protein
MTLKFNIMVEGQEGLDWARWQALARAAEDGGWDGLYRSDHLTGLAGDSSRACLDTWTSLAWLATATKRIRFGPLVCPLTFYHPAILAKQAAAIDQLAGGRLDLGLGAGWNDHEHRMFGVPFPPLRERMDRLDCGARLIRALWRGEPVTLDQPHYPLVEARIEPRPARGTLPLVIGGRGERRTLRAVAEFADEWNVTRVTPDELRAKAHVLERHCAAVGREPSEIGRSLMIPVAIGRTPAEAAARRERAHALFPRIPADEASWRTAAFLQGTPAAVIADLRRWAAVGVQRVMCQMLDMTDLEAMDLIAHEVVPAFRR